MTEELPPYSGEDAQCVKCSNTGAFTEWRPAESLGTTVLKAEHLRRQCTRCDYRWDEALNPPKEQR